MFKIPIAQIMVETKFKRSFNQIRQCLKRHVQICYQFFDKKIIKYFNDFQITQCYDERELKQWE